MSSARATCEDEFIQIIPRNPGIVIEEIAPLMTTSVDWKIIQRIDLTSHFLQGNKLLTAWRQITRVCAPLNGICIHNQQLKNMYKQIMVTERETERITELLQGHNSNNNDNTSRKRRSLLPFIGKATRYLFGNLDEEAETELKTIIEIARNDTRKIANLLANQTELIEIEFDQLHTKLSNIEQTINNYSRNTVEIIEREKIDVSINMLSEATLQYELDTALISDAILFAAQGAIHPRFLPPNLIKNSENLVKQTIQDAIFPNINKNITILEIIKIADLAIVFSNFQLIYYLSIPLLDFQKYKLYKISPIPVKQNLSDITNTFAYIWPQSPYIAMSEHKTYMPITLDAVNKCKKIKELNICKESEPIREVQKHAACELKLLINTNLTSFSDCNIKLTKLYDTYWMRLHAPNSWMFSTIQKEQIFIQCRRTEQLSVEINGIGILKLNPGCTAHTLNARLMASQEIRTKIINTIFPEYELNIDNILKNNTNNNYSQYINDALNQTQIHTTKGQHNEQNHPLKIGTGFQEIIQKAKTIGEYRSVSESFDILQKQVTIFGGSFIAVAVICGVLWKLFPAGGPLTLIRKRLFSGSNQQQNVPNGIGASTTEIISTRVPQQQRTHKTQNRPSRPPSLENNALSILYVPHPENSRLHAGTIQPYPSERPWI